MTHELVIERSVPAGRERVFDALTRPESLKAWFWPPRFQTDVAVDLRVGGEYFLRSPSMAMGVEGRFHEVVVPESLAFDWRWDGQDLVTEVRLHLAPDPEATRLVLTHSGFATAADRDDHIQGWNDCLDRLDPWLLDQTPVA